MEPEEGPQVTTMGGCMLAGELEIRKVKKKAILIVGDTRVGKSTLFNLLLKVPLIGVEIEDGADVIYQHEFHEGVQTKNTYKSVTLVPNVGQVNLDGEDVSLVDLAGFSDQARSYVGIFGVSFMLEKILDSIEEFKFVLTISHPNFEMAKVEDFIKPFLSFIKILHIEVLLEETQAQVAEKFFNSISVVVVKSRNQQKFYISKITKILQHLESIPNLENERKIIKMILTSILNNKRIQLFKKAEPEQRPSQQQILEKLNQNPTWNFYKFEDNLPKDVLFLLPFEEQFKEMKDADKNQYKNDFQTKSKKMKNSYELLKKFFNKAHKNWYSTQVIDYQEQFDILSQIIKDHPYGSFDLMLQELKIDFHTQQGYENKVTRLDLLDRFKQIQKASQQINDANEGNDTQIKIHSMTGPCLRIFDIFRKMVCTNREQQDKFIVFMFINMRYLYESQMQYKVDNNSGSGIPFIVNQNLTNILSTSIENLNAEFFLDFKEYEEEKEKFTEMLHVLIQDINSIADPEQAKKLLLVNINIAVKAGKRLIKKSCYKQALQKLLAAYKDFQNFVQLLPPEDERQGEDKSIFKYKSNQIYDLIGICLQNLNFHRLAAKLYTYTKSIYHLIKCYETKIAKQKRLKKKYELFEDYIQILQKNKKTQKLISVYQQIIQTFRVFPERIEAIQQHLTSLKQNKQSKENVEDPEILNITEIIEEIQSDLSYHVDEDIEDDEESEDQDQVFRRRNQDVEKEEQDNGDQ